MKVVSIVGARPQFVKAAAVSRVLRKHCGEILVHTGQHYDYGMSEVFFKELSIPEPDYNLGVGSGSHGAQTGQMMIGIEEVLLRESPDLVMVYGDTNSTLAGAICAVKLHIPLAHVEAGLRSFKKTMPEEVNRVLTDHASSFLFCPTEQAVVNLEREGISRGVHLVGDVMYDALLYNSRIAGSASGILREMSLSPRSYMLATVHRAENTDDRGRLSSIFRALCDSGVTTVLPLHPRTRRFIEEWGMGEEFLSHGTLKVIPPAGYLDMLSLEQNARAIITDSGGVQKEAYLFGVPCITLRDETEWVETVEQGANVLVGALYEKILGAVRGVPERKAYPPLYGDGNASGKIVSILTASQS